MKALAHIAADAETLQRFLAITGLEPAELRRRAEEPELLAAILDFVLSDDSICERFAAAEGLDATTLHQARRALPGATND